MSFMIILKKNGMIYGNSFHKHTMIMTTICYLCGKVGHETSKCRNLPKIGSSNDFRTNKKGPKKIWVPNDTIIPIANIFDRKKDTLIMVLGQWLLTSHDRRKYIFQCLTPMHGGTITLGRNWKGKITEVGKIDIHPYPPIENFLFVKGLKHNLLSISQLCDNGHNASFNKEGCIAQNTIVTLLFTAKRKGNMYKSTLLSYLNKM